jgi:small subunit ribosomal protein S20
MAITSSAKKALRQEKKRRIRNVAAIKKMKGAVKEIRSLVLQKKNEEAKKMLPQIYKILDKSAKSNIVKKNTASRLKSRIATLVNKAP